MYDGLPVSGVGLDTGCLRSALLGSAAVPTPAAGADLVYTVPDAGAIYEVVAIRARLVTSAAVANRAVAVVVKDAAGTEVYREGFDTAVTAGLTNIFTFSPEVGVSSGGITQVKAIVLGIPRGPYLPRWTISTVTTLIDVGDQWSQVAIWYRELWLAPDGEHGG